MTSQITESVVSFCSRLGRCSRFAISMNFDATCILRGSMLGLDWHGWGHWPRCRLRWQLHRIAIAAGLAAAQALAMPHLTQLFTPLPEVREAIRRPAQVSALVQLSNGVVFAGEGVMMGLGAFGYLAGLTAIGVAVMVAGLQISAARNLGVASVWWSLLGFHAVLTVGQLLHHLRLGPLARAKQPATSPELEAEVDCAPVPLVGEVCILSEPEAGDGEEAVEA